MTMSPATRVVFLGGLGVILIFRERGWHVGGALVAALAFSFGGANASRIQHVGQVESLCWLPLALLFLMRALERRSWTDGAAAGLFAGFIMIGRDQVSLLALYVLLGFLVWHWCADEGRVARMRASIVPLLSGAVVGALIVWAVGLLIGPLLQRVVLPALLLVLWEAGSRAGVLPMDTLSRPSDIVRAAWEGWQTVSQPLKKDYVRFVELANTGAKELGFADSGAMWRGKYDMPADDFTKELDRLWGQVKPLYDTLHAYVRLKLHDKYGDAVPATGPIPAYMLGNIAFDSGQITPGPTECSKGLGSSPSSRWAASFRCRPSSTSSRRT
mgnify:CR=1 FL=1